MKEGKIHWTGRK